jgi:hypothetical protein
VAEKDIMQTNVRLGETRTHRINEGDPQVVPRNVTRGNDSSGRTPGIGITQINPGTSLKNEVVIENEVETIISHVTITDHRITTDSKEVTVEAAMTTEAGRNRKTGNRIETNDHDTIARKDKQTTPGRINVDKTITTMALEIGTAP